MVTCRRMPPYCWDPAGVEGGLLDVTGAMVAGAEVLGAVVATGAEVVATGALVVAALVVCVEVAVEVDVDDVPQAASTRLAMTTTTNRIPSFLLISNSLF